MNIRYPLRSEFIEVLRLGIKQARARLDAGLAIEIQLEPGGYKGKKVVIVRPDNSEEFETTGSMRDPTRFPQRIRAAAWALYQEGAFGRFVIEHDPECGVLTVRRDV